jgi:hypothetical protein
MGELSSFALSLFELRGLTGRFLVLDRTMGKLGVKAVRPFMKDPIDEGCRSALYAATAVEVGTKPIDGEYIVPDCKVTDVSKEAKDEQLAEVSIEFEPLR